MAENLPPNPAQPATPREKPEEKEKSALGRLKNWLIDSYNGLFKIVIQPQLPKRRLTGFMILAFLLGMVWAYSIKPVQYYDGAPADDP